MRPRIRVRHKVLYAREARSVLRRLTATPNCDRAPASLRDSHESENAQERGSVLRRLTVPSNCHRVRV